MIGYGEKIKNLRKEKGLTQEQLADLINIGRSALSLYEIEARQPDPETLKNIADTLNVSTDFLLGRTDTTVEKISETGPVYLVKDERIPGGELRIKMKPEWKGKGLTPEKIERIIDQALAYDSILNNEERKNK